ncbi:uncharacterized protein LOC111302112 [Durio zibethinus]|uniref:Uncharacterized protein LOC111302112 n=1 Tax=Durio zibethinus TaxID=66656 RepID=A0A6P5ZNB0_DURZI|nr:uncharacterized protein LOC111302112 [Durio zibethinus]XP_022753881.1 uncharacterized protein LOC111302112 [Durio zibethinus]XP_022753942.1 uncharacterized protein LOC111302112 [Durio zibethinus]XP_022754005.1 uncharacterized protein LOC111302112 [Durio zibethinus]XP_022754065.1 uncharacterized protein LOC111302112 [Durio zibethinus]XP_022754104.1 uncharacterized protein LOC111302112 [Durio zibethinus]XP_022754143.1 uncharacterized protein LOC111302112 [Durio zibethinus]
MTLEDFFTLTEMKDGLTSPSRVEELLTVMKKGKDSVVKNVSDATRQWTAVASTIAATENKDCLDLFIQLDGLWFLGRWLKDAQDFGNDSSDSFEEESISALLRALEMLHRNNERSISSEIWITVKNLLVHNSPRVQDRARLLFDNWKRGRVTDDVQSGVDSGGRDFGISDNAIITGENGGTECSAKDVPVAVGSAHEENDGVDAAKNENLPSNLDGVQPERAKDLYIETTNDQVESHINSDCADMENKSPNHMASTFVPNPIQEKSSMKEELPAKTVEETASPEACSLPELKQENVGVSVAQKLNGVSTDEKKLDMTVFSSSTLENVLVSSGSGVGSAQEAVTEPNLQNDSEANKSDVLKSVALGDDSAPVSQPKKAMGDAGVTNHSGNGSHLCMLQSSPEKEFIYGKPGDLETTFSRMEDIGTVDEDKESCGVEHLRGGTNFTHSPDVIDSRTSDIELEYGLVDALEVARKVAQEVEREVVDDREPSCSSSEKISGVGIRQPGTPDSINGKQDLPTQLIPKEVSTGPNQSAETYNEVERHIINSDNVDNEPENDLHDMEASQLTVIQEPELNTQKSLCDFDLNQEVCSDDMERAVNSISTPISVVSASRAAAAPCLPVAPLQFEGALGWKGSAATSAFHPASPRRNSDGEKTLSLGGTSSSSKQRLDCLDFDLNVAEAGDEKGAELMSGKQVTVSPGLHSVESSLEVSPRKSKRLKLDLNLISDDAYAPALESRVEGQLFYNRNGHRSPSPASSSSSMQFSLRNIDLNDRPYSHNDASEHGTYHGGSSRNVNAYGGPKLNNPVISIMGTRVEVNRKDVVPQVVSLPNGKALEPATDASMTRTVGFLGLGPTVSYAHSPAFSYNGLAMAPTMSFSSAIYGASGSIPYMVDSRASVVPQMMGSTSAVRPAYSQPQFIMSMSNAPVGLNGSVPSRPNFDLNSGLAIEGVNRDSIGVRPSFLPGQDRSIEDHLRANSQPSSSGVVAKRKEPDGGWEPHLFNYRHQQFP